MAHAQQSFGRRALRVYHGCISLNARKKTFCTIVRRVNRVIYIELAESVQIPFTFRIDFEHDRSWIDCEFKSQTDSVLAAHMTAASFDAIAEAKPATVAVMPHMDIDEINRWCGSKIF